MSEYTITDVEVTRDIPGNPEAKGGPAKVLRFSLEGDDRTPEMFTTARTKAPAVGDKVSDDQLTFSEQWNRWEFKKKKEPQFKGGGSFGKKSPEQEKRIVRQHSQEQAIRVMAILGYVLPEESFINLVNWMEDDAYGKLKSGTNAWPMTSDVPADLSDTPFG